MSLALVAALLAGCASGADSAGGSSASISARFAAAVGRADFQAQGPISGTIDLAAAGETVELTMSGGFRIRDQAVALSSALELEGSQATYDAVYLGGWMYSRANEEPWLRQSRTDRPDPFAALFGWPGGFDDRGIQARSGQRLHRLALRGAPQLEPSTFGIPSSGMHDVRTNASLWAGDDGTPAGLTIELAWTEDAGGTTATATATMDFTFATLSGVETIEVPPGAPTS